MADHDALFGPLIGRPVSLNPNHPELPPLWATLPPIELGTNQTMPAIADACRDFMRVVVSIVDAASAAIASFGRQVETTYQWLQRVGYAPPDCTDMLAGEKWRSPITGTQYRVAGKRGNRHWIESGPRRARWW